MKRFFFFILTISLLFLFTGCLSIFGIPYAGLNPIFYDYSSPYMDPTYGYEVFPWGSSYHTIEKQTNWILHRSKFSNDECWLGNMSSSSSPEPHGNKDSYVNATYLYFDRLDDSNYEKSYLYEVIDIFKKTPSMDFLHSRYGQFSENNLGTSQHKIYKGKSYFNVDGSHALEIEIYDNGKTIVTLQDPFFRQYLRAGNPLNNWTCYPELDRKNKRINYIFLNKNEEGKYLFIGYSKGYENPYISYVRTGICWDKDINGKYEIKGDEKLISKDFSSEKWNSVFENKDYIFTNNKEESARELLDLFIENKRIVVRHNDIISEFLTKESTILDKMADYGISWAEIDTALANEEFF